MPHPIYGHPTHELETVTATLKLPTPRTGLDTTLEVQGRSSTQRRALWSYRESWGAGEQRGGLEPADTLHWLILAAIQDRPGSPEGLKRSITPQGWQDVQLPF